MKRFILVLAKHRSVFFSGRGDVRTMAACVQDKEGDVAIGKVVIVAARGGGVIIRLAVVQAVALCGIGVWGYIRPFSLIIVDEL